MYVCSHHHQVLPGGLGRAFHWRANPFCPPTLPSLASQPILPPLVFRHWRANPFCPPYSSIYLGGIGTNQKCVRFLISKLWTYVLIKYIIRTSINLITKADICIHIDQKGACKTNMVGHNSLFHCSLTFYAYN